MLYIEEASAEVGGMGFVGGKITSFAVGSKKPLTNKSFVEVPNSSKTYNELQRFFLRMVETQTSTHSGDHVALSGVSVKHNMFPAHFTFYAPMIDSSHTSSEESEHKIIKFGLSNGEIKYFEDSAIFRTVEHPSGTASVIQVGEILLDDHSVRVISKDTSIPSYNVCFTRSSAEWDYAHEGERVYDASSKDSKYLSLRFKVYQNNSQTSTIERGYAYFDDSMLQTSNVLWEFSPDSGKTWYCNYTLPNVPYQRISLPYKTNQVRVRATSRSDEEWVRGYSLQPHPSWKLYGKYVVGTTVTDPSVHLSESSSNMSWYMDFPVPYPLFAVTYNDSSTENTKRFRQKDEAEKTISSVSVVYPKNRTTL